VTWVMSNLILIHLDTVFVLVQDRCMVCPKHTIGSDTILDAPDNSKVTWVMSVCANCTIGSDIVLDTPDGTPRCQG
jgi:hypothetical protein